MKFRLGKPIIGEAFEPEVEGWKPIREPGPILMQFLAIPIVVLSVGWTVAAFYLLGEFPFEAPSFGGIALLFVVLVPAHELLHAVVNPYYGLSKRTHIGFWPKTFLFYAVYDGEMSRNRFLFVCIAPTFVLTICPLVIASVAGSVPSVLVVVALLNSLANAGDLFGILLIGFQVPNAALVQNKGWRTYWRMPDEADLRLESEG